MKFSTTIKCAITSIALLTVSSAQAAYSCTANVNSVLVYADGTVNVNHSGRNDFTYVCNLNTSWKSVATPACAGWLALLLQAKRNNTPLQFYYDGTSACSALPTYGDAPAPTYIGQ